MAKMVKVLMVAEIDLDRAQELLHTVDPKDVVSFQVDSALDEFRESVLPAMNYGITLYRATQEDCGEFTLDDTSGWVPSIESEV